MIKVQVLTNPINSRFVGAGEQSALSQYVPTTGSQSKHGRHIAGACYHCRMFTHDTC